MSIFARGEITLYYEERCVPPGSDVTGDRGLGAARQADRTLERA